MRLRLLILLAILISSLLATAVPAGAEKQISVLFASGSFVGRTMLDEKLRGQLIQNGIDLQVDTCFYKELDAARLSRCNLLIMTYAPTLGANDTVREFHSAMQPIVDYVEHGGGLIVMGDDNYESYKVLNEFLTQIDAEILPESPVDASKLYQQPAYLRHWYCSTENISRHSVTEGVKSVWYPMADSPDTGNGTQIMRLGAAWSPLICANPSAYYYRTKLKEEGKQDHGAPQPILGVREFGKGRVIAFSTRSVNYLEHPYHRVFEGLCLDRGDGLKLVQNMLTWVSQPALEAGQPGGYTQPEQSDRKPGIDVERLKDLDYYQRADALGVRKFRTFPADYTDPFSDGLSDFVGLIGVRTAYSQQADESPALSTGTVKDYCDIAKRQGYSYVVFAETFENMSRDKWAKLVANCKAESGEKFAAVPGIEIKDIYGDTWAVFDMTRWPDPEWLDKSETRIANSPGFYFGLGHRQDEFLARYLLTPKSAMFKPWESKFYAGMEVFSYNRGSVLFSDAFDYYLRCQMNDCNMVPITTQRITAPIDIYNVNGLLTHVRARSAEEIAEKFRYRWYQDRQVYLSSGPELTRWSMDNGRGGFREEEWRATVGIRSKGPIKSVVIYDRDKIFRRFVPNTTDFHTTLAGYHDKQRFLVLVAEDVEGHKLISPALYTSDRRQSQYMCTDLQNTINCSRDISPEGKEVFYPGVGYGVTGWDNISVSVATADIVPACGFEFGGGGWGFSSSAYLPGLEGNCWTMAARDMAFSTGDCNVLRDVFDVTLLPGSIPAEIPSVKTVCRHTAYTPRLDGLNIHRAQHSVTLLRDYTLADGQTSEFLRCMGGGLAESAFPTYVVVDESGHKTTAARDAKTSLDLTLKPGSYFASFPYMWGSFAIMPLNGDIHLKLRGGAFDVGHDMTGSMSAGTHIGTDVIYICGKFGSVDEKDFDHFRSAFGLAGSPTYKYRVTRGKLMSTRYIFDMQAEGGWAAAEIGRADMGSDLPINVRGLNENWDAGFLDMDSHELRRVGVYEGRGILTRDIDDKGVRFACGNMVTCDKPDIFLSIFQRGGKWVVEAHNPTMSAARPRVRVARWLKGHIPSLDRVVNIPAGSTVTIRL